jgi:hypothetical protein
MPKLIGGLYPLSNPGKPKYNSDKSLYLCNARSGLYILNKILQPRIIWLPSYLCPSLIHPDYKIEFYKIDDSLNIAEDFEPASNDLVVVIKYFGMPPTRIPDRGYILEDCCQSIFKIEDCFVNDYADFRLYSS